MTLLRPLCLRPHHNPGCFARFALQAVGAVTILSAAFNGLRQLWRFVKPRASAAVVGAALQKKYRGAGAWAVVTGGSDGIGRELAVQLAVVGGFNVCVLARTQSKLDDVVAEIQSRAPSVQAKAIAFDFSTTDPLQYEALVAQLDALDGGVGILVNNVGMSHVNAELYEEPPVGDDVKLLHVNCVPSLYLAKFIIPKWKANGKGGLMVNLSSFVAVARAVPYVATYAATKAFNRVFSNSLTYELRPFGIDVVCVTPGLVSTAMTQGFRQGPRTNFQMVDATEMAQDVLQALAFRGSSVDETAGHRSHVLFQAFVETFVSVRSLGAKTYAMMKQQSDFRKARRNRTLADAQ